MAESSKFYRLLILASGLFVFAALYSLRRFGLDNLYESVMNFWGVPVGFRPYIPFVDIHEYLAATECSRRGLDVYVADPCDILLRPHVYPIWLVPHLIGLGTADRAWLGTSLGIAFLCSAALIANPHTIRQTAVYILALLSTACGFAVERANMDLIVFVVIVIASLTFYRTWIGRSIAYLGIFFVALLKFYPIVGMGLAVYERKYRLISIAAVTMIASLIFLYLTRHNMAEMIPNFPPMPPAGTVFGGSDYFFIIRNLLARRFPDEAQHIAAVSVVAYAIARLAAIIAAFVLFRRWGPKLAGNLGSQQEQVLFLVGGITIVFAFFIGVSVSYREILLLLLLPGLFSAWRSAPRDSRARFLWAAAIAVTISLQWFEFFPVNLERLTGAYQSAIVSVLVIREPLWWVFIIGLMILLWTRISATPFVGRLAIFHPQTESISALDSAPARLGSQR